MITSFLKTLSNWALTALYVQSVCFVTTLPILFFWQIPFSILAHASNLFFFPIMVAYLFASLCFCALGPILPPSLCLKFSVGTELWLDLMAKAPTGSLIMPNWQTMLAWGACATALYLLPGRIKRIKQLAAIAAWLALTGVAIATSNTSKHTPIKTFELISKHGSIEFTKKTGVVTAHDKGFLKSPNATATAYTIRKELLKHFGQAKLDSIKLHKKSKRAILCAHALATVTGCKICFDAKPKRKLK